MDPSTSRSEGTRINIRKEPTYEHAGAVERVVESRYDQLLKWSELLSRADSNLAREIVQELCLYFALAKPDLSGIANLDGYLYTSLRNIYLSRIARSSREALRSVSVGDFDSIHFAITSGRSSDLVDTQNELRRICCYSIWRKELSKSFSYLILHFFHGYFPREIAEIACLPISAIYNKLKTSRTELRSYLAEPNKLAFSDREVPPEPKLPWTPISTAELLRELRESILQARVSECLPDEELLAHYRGSRPSPLPRSLLSHIVSCEQCLGLVDHHFRRPTLKDRDPLDGFDRPLERTDASGKGTQKSDARAMLDWTWRRRGRLYEHRPRTLFIAVNGRIVSFHDVQGEYSVLGARIDPPDSARFVEIFSEQDIRLALVTIDDLPPEGPHTLMQQIVLSDGRWLRLNLTFDGLGLQSGVEYFDPALAITPKEDEQEDRAEQTAASEPVDLISGLRLVFSPQLTGLPARIFRRLTLSPTLVWATIIGCLLCGAGYLAYRYKRAPLDAEAVLKRSVDAEAASLRGATEHQVLNLEETMASGRVLKGIVEIWKDGDSGRYMRRLYDGRDGLIAAEWRRKDGKTGSYTADGSTGAPDEARELAESELWKEDVSACGFRMLATEQMRITTTDLGYELSAGGAIDRGVHLVSVVLVLDKDLDPVGEILQVRSTSGLREVRLMQTKFERRPSSTIPDSVFNPEQVGTSSSEDREFPDSAMPTRTSPPVVADAAVRLARLQIAVLYRLNELNADIAEPIEVARIPDGYIRVSGTVSDQTRRSKILSALKSLPDHEFLRIRLGAQSNVRVPAPGVTKAVPPSTNVYDVAQTEAPADAVLRRYFAREGMAGDQVESAVMQFSKDALGHAQRALQHAYALDRLGNDFTAEELHSIGPTFRRQWADMAQRHASALESEFRALHEQIVHIRPDVGESPELKRDGLAIAALQNLHALPVTCCLNPRVLTVALAALLRPAHQRESARIRICC